MTDGIIGNSALHMSDVPLPVTEIQAEWGSLLTNRIMVVAAVLVMLINLPTFFKIAGTILECMRIARANLTLEHSYAQASMRSQSAWSQLLPVALLADRFDIIRPAFFDEINGIWHAPMVLGILLAYLTVRLTVFILARPLRMNGEVTDTVHRILFTMVTALSTTALISTGILLLAGASDASVRSVLLWETGVFFALTLLREGQILGSHCNGLSTFLYLCALEMVPAAGLLIAVTIY